MGELIKVSFDKEQNEQLVSAKELHEKLGIRKDFSAWFRYQVEKIEFIEGNDFTPILEESTGGRPGTDYVLTLEAAKHLCMISGGPKSHEIRQYFIEVEKAWNSPEMVMARALQMSDRTINNLTQKLKSAERFQKQIAASENTLLVREVAKLASKDGIRIGEKRLWQKLRDWGMIFRGKTEPYQRFIERGYFEVTEGVVETSKGTFTHRTTRVTGSGQLYIIKKLVEEEEQAVAR